MKLALKILAGVLGFIFLLIITLNIYFTNERLQSIVMPYVDEAVGRSVEVESLSLTFFSTFPRPGLSINNMNIPGETEQDTLASLDELVVGVELFSLFGDEISISEIKLDRPRFTYTVYEDSTTNLDFLMAEETEEDPSEAYAINIPYLEVTGGSFGYNDRTTQTKASFNDLNADITLRYADLIESTADLTAGGFSASSEGSSYVSDLPVSLTQQSTIDMDSEVLDLTEGTLSIRGLGLNLSGTISDWSNDMAADLAFNTSSDNLDELLRLVPPEFAEYTEGLDTRGSVSIDGSLQGPLAGEELPDFDFNMNVTDGYLKNPDLPQAVEQIQLQAEATNELLTVRQFEATAGDNAFTASGEMENPLEEDGPFSLDMSGDIDLATVSEFFDIAEFDIEELSGMLALNITANGNRNDPENATFDGTFNLSDGLLQYADVARPIEDINIDADATEERISIQSLGLMAADNSFSMQGTVQRPLDEVNRSVDLETDLRFDLATVKEFYPISEDTLSMKGMLTAQATLRGAADQIERSVQSGTITLENGRIDYAELGQPIEDITFESSLEGNLLTINNARFVMGENSLSGTGSITDYLSENPAIDLQLDGLADFSEIAQFYDLEPTINELTGTSELNLSAKGPIYDPAAMTFNGSLNISNLVMRGDSLIQPVENLNGELELSPQSADLTSLSFDFGSSDIRLSGSLSDYMQYLRLREDREAIPQLSGTYHSDFLNMDELIDWEDTTDSEPTPIYLPHLNSSVTAEIGELLITGVTMRQVEGSAGTTPERIELEEATAELFDGQATGSFIWNVPDPERTEITFEGALDSLQAERFFEEYAVLGEESKVHEYLSGAFSAEVTYFAELDEFLTPDIESTEMDGSFGMTKARFRGHPIQEEVADFLGVSELSNMALDEWQSTFTVSNSVLTFEDLQLTSGDIGAEISGTQHLVNDEIDFDIRLFLPPQFKDDIASVITERATEALEQENGTIMVPLKATRTSADPRIRPDEDVIRPIIEEYLKEQGGNVLRKLFDGN